MISKPLRLAITGGGTGGHVSPAVAVIEALREQVPGDSLDLLYLGSREGAEARIIPLMGVGYKAVSTGKLRRYFSLQNVADTARVPMGTAQALYHLSRFRPKALLATGGYVSVPVVMAAAILKIPTLVHEQTGALGLANRLNARVATKIALSVPGSERGLPRGNWVLTGNPVRRAVLGGDETIAARRFRFDTALPTTYITGGAQGSHAINTAVESALPGLLKATQIIHQCGDSAGTRADYESLSRRMIELPATLGARYRLLPYIGQEIGEVYALADLVVGRAGAGTVNELTTLGKPSILIPLPRAAGDEQRHNARRLESTGGAVVIEEEELKPGRLVEEVTALLSNPTRLQSMAAAARATTTEDPARALAYLLLDLARHRTD